MGDVSMERVCVSMERVCVSIEGVSEGGVCVLCVCCLGRGWRSRTVGAPGAARTWRRRSSSRAEGAPLHGREHPRGKERRECRRER